MVLPHYKKPSYKSLKLLGIWILRMMSFQHGNFEAKEFALRKNFEQREER